MDDRVLRKCAYPGLDVTSEAFQDQHIAGDFKQKGSREGEDPEHFVTECESCAIQLAARNLTRELGLGDSGDLLEELDREREHGVCSARRVSNWLQICELEASHPEPTGRK